MPYPNFLIIGPGKSGTTWIYNVLNAHPEVCMASAKETMFFNEYFHKGFDWYLSFFSHCNNYNSIGEVTNTYIFSDQAPARMYHFNSTLQLIPVLRNPVDRAFSHYLFLLRNGEHTGSFEEVIECRPDILERGLYSIYLNRYLSFFPFKQLVILFFDDLQKDSISFGNHLFSIFGISADYSAIQTANQNKLPASAARSRLIANLVKKLALKTRDWGRPDWVTKIKNSRITNLLYKPYMQYPTMNPDTRKRLEEYFYDDVEQLSKLTNRDLKSQWLQFR